MRVSSENPGDMHYQWAGKYLSVMLHDRTQIEFDSIEAVERLMFALGHALDDIDRYRDEGRRLIKAKSRYDVPRETT